MKPTLTHKQQQILTLLKREFEATGQMPTFQRIASMLGFKSLNAVTCHLRALEKKGFLQKNALRELSSSPSSESGSTNFRLPLAASIPAGEAAVMEETPHDVFELTPAFFSRGTLTAVRIVGHSMTGDAISDGDIGIIHMQKTATKGDILAVRVRGDEITLKRINFVNEGGGGFYELLPSNPDFPVRRVPAQDLEIIGKFVGLIRKLRS